MLAQARTDEAARRATTRSQNSAAAFSAA